MRPSTYFFIALLIIMFLPSCGGGGSDEEPAIPPTEMTITLEGVEDYSQPFEAGTVIRLLVHFEPASTTVTTVGWVSSNPDVATIDDNGNLMLLNNGTTVITAVSVGNPKLTWSATINVKDGSIQINPNNNYGQNEAE